MLSVAFLAVVALGGVMFAFIEGRGGLGGLALLLYLIMMPSLFWWIGRRLHRRLLDDPPARSDVLMTAAPSVIAASSFGSGLLGMAIWITIAALPYLGLWLGLGLHRKDARLI